MKKNYLLSVLYFNLIFSLLFIFNVRLYGQNTLSIVPQPNQIMVQKGEFILPSTWISFGSSLSPFAQSYLQEETAILLVKGKPTKSNLIFQQIKDTLPKGSYTLNIRPTSILIQYQEENGLLYAISSLGQIIQHSKNRILTCAEIKDQPRFVWRGLHLDVSRHFMRVDSIVQVLDVLLHYKMNVFHWHLTDDQGWRIEIKKYPLLTQKGAYRERTLKGHLYERPYVFKEVKHGGFYTQEQIKWVVQKAQERGIMVVPEIEMPGHAQAAITAYPWLGVTGKVPGVWDSWGISPYLFKPSDSTFTFLQDVLSEVMTLFPAPYIHIGGDEALKDQWKSSPAIQAQIKQLGLKDEDELQSWFIKKMDTYLTSKGKILMGWDEILEGGLSPNATVMSWRGTKGGEDAANEGHDVVMTPGSFCYFDSYQCGPFGEPLAIGGNLSPKRVYGYEPIPANLSANKHKHIMGVQANIWTEYIPSMRQVWYMMLPRLGSMAEVGWTNPKLKSWPEMQIRLQGEEGYWKKKGYYYNERALRWGN